MQRLFALYLITLMMCSCASKPKAQPFDADWEFRDGMACMKKEDVIKLMILLNECSDRK